MGKTVVITEEIFIKHAVKAFENLNEIKSLTPSLMIFAGIYATEIAKTFFF